MKTEIETLAEKHGGTVIDYSLPEGPQAADTTVIMATSGLAALIAEVRRQAMEEAAVICDDYDNGDYAADQWDCAKLLRARMEERK